MVRHPARDEPAPGVAQVEEEEKDPCCDAELAVVVWVRLPETVAVVPDAVFVMVKVADPAPPATASSSVSLSSMRISAIRLSLLLMINDGAAWLSAIRAWSLRADVVRTQPLHMFQTLVSAWRRANVVRTQPLHLFQTLVRAWRSHA